MSQEKNNDHKEETYYDFYSENTVLHWLGGVLPYRKSPVLHFLNIVYATALMALYFFLMMQCVYTLIYVPVEKALGIRVFHTLILTISGKMMFFVLRYYEDNMRKASMILLKRDAHYSIQDENELSIKKHRVHQIKVFVTFLAPTTLACSLSNTFLLPLATYLFGNVAPSDALLNPYLPLPIYIPFNTKIYLGYAIAFFMEGWFLLTLYVLTFAFAETYMCYLLQFIGQLEVLEHSLKSIRLRAEILKTTIKPENYNNMCLDCEMEFTVSMNVCLKENIIHHQFILRLMKILRPLLEANNTVCVTVFCVLLAVPLIVIIQNPKSNIFIALMCAVATFGYLSLCIVGEMVIDKSARLQDALYQTPWYECKKDFGKSIAICISFAQYPIIVRTKGLSLDSSLKTYGDMVSAGYKLMNILMTQM